MHYVYVLKSTSKDWKYIGCTDDLRARVDKHQKRKVKSTQAHAPFNLIYYEAYLSKSDARKREYELKHNARQRELLYKRISNSLHMAPSSSLV